jgi:hypothetical protein
MQISASRIIPRRQARAARACSPMSGTSRSIGAGIAGQPDPAFRRDQPSPDRLSEQPASFEQVQDNLSAGKVRHPRISGRSVGQAMAQAFDIDACMKVVLTPSGGDARLTQCQLSLPRPTVDPGGQIRLVRCKTSHPDCLLHDVAHTLDCRRANHVDLQQLNRRGLRKFQNGVYASNL